jgi:hypothetical protein
MFNLKGMLCRLSCCRGAVGKGSTYNGRTSSQGEDKKVFAYLKELLK